jgi:hypothetical protein
MYINSKSMPSKNASRTGFEILNRARLIVLENVLCINSCNFLRRIKIGGTTKDQFVMFYAIKRIHSKSYALVGWVMVPQQHIKINDIQSISHICHCLYHEH